MLYLTVLFRADSKIKNRLKTVSKNAIETETAVIKSLWQKFRKSLCGFGIGHFSQELKNRKKAGVNNWDRR